MIANNEERLNALLKADSIYQSLLTQCLHAEEDYHRICTTLCENDRLSLERYIILCEELDHRKLQLALSQQA